ncbi:hypothetical protein [Deinococcus aluminii]|uniref:Uncharacterized protein n=1 Tax=Deinococcus aluminii TaxID=1656885 RepID=A0ABP9XG88_9DEIO
MNQEMLNVLALPLLFSLLGGTYIYRSDPERRAAALQVMILFQTVGALGQWLGPHPALFALLTLHALVLLPLLVRHLHVGQAGPAPLGGD